jgi:hypothetical protein
MVSYSEIQEIFKILLDREAEKEALIHFEKFPSTISVISAVTLSDEYRLKYRPSKFDHFHSTIDAISIVRKFEMKDRIIKDGYRVNYFGVAIPDAVLPSEILDHIPLLEFDPIPNNWHADTAEFAAALRAVDLSKDTFTMIELGCGWGCWMNITGKVAKKRGLRSRLIGVEGDTRNINLAKRTLRDNEFIDDEYCLIHGIAGANDGSAAFPQQGVNEESWGLEPIFSDDSKRYSKAVSSGRYSILPVVGLEQIMHDYKKIDLMHVDIQGGESNLIRDGINVLSKKVAYVVIGTHSRKIEGEIMDQLFSAGWILEIERPAFINLTTLNSLIDGVQGWKNPKFHKNH